MIRTLLLSVFMAFLALTNGHAQLAKGNLLIGGNAGFSIQFVDGGDNLLNLSLNPNVLSFISDNVALGGALGLNYLSQGGISQTSFGLLPAARVYFPGENEGMSFFFDAQVGLQLISADFGSGSDSESAVALRIGPGVAHFISEDVSIDAGLSFNYLGGNFDQSNLGLNIGLQVFLIRKSNE